MQLSKLAAKPQLVKYVLDSEEIVAEYGEPVEFFSWDRQPLTVFMSLANAGTDNNAEMFTIMRGLILDEKGKQIITDDNMLPTKILLAAVAKLVEGLGK